MWNRLENVYSDISHTVQSTFANLIALKHVKSDDLPGLVHFIKEIGQLSAVTLSQIDSLRDLLFIGIRKKGMR